MARRRGGKLCGKSLVEILTTPEVRFQQPSENLQGSQQHVLASPLVGNFPQPAILRNVRSDFELNPTLLRTVTTRHTAVTTCTWDARSHGPGKFAGEHLQI